VTVSGAGFPKRTTGQILFADSPVGMPTVTAGGNGSFTTTLRVPDLSPGSQEVAVAGERVTARATFVVSSATAPTDPAWSQIGAAGLEGGNLSEFDATSVEHGSLTVAATSPGAAAGSRFAVAQTSGTGDGVNGFSRGQWTVAWGRDTVYRAEVSVFLPVGFYASQQGAVQLMGWDTFPTLNNHMRLAIWQSDHLARLYLKADGRDTTLTNAFAIPEGRWIRVALEQKIADGGGWSRVYLDDQLVAQGSGDTAAPYPVTRLRVGLVAIDAHAQTRPLTLLFDDVRLSLAR
jgi:hypothetical protein